MDGFHKQAGCWYVDSVPLSGLAEHHSTPCYVYSQWMLLDAYHRLQGEFCHSCPKICYAVKANDNLSLLKILVEAGAGFDIVSGGELARVLAAGGLAQDIVFSGVGKSQREIEAALAAQINCFNVESAEEFWRIQQRAAALGHVAPIAFRLTLDIDGDTHQHLTTGLSGGKFGLSVAEGQLLAQQAAASPHIDFLGFSCHIGSQIADETIYLRLAEAMAAQVAIAQAQGINIRRVDMGGGFAVDDSVIGQPRSTTLSWQRYDRLLSTLFTGKQLLIEPGRYLAAAAGVLLTRIEYVKLSGDKTIWVTNAGMTDLLRPALYDAHHPVVTAIDRTEAPVLGDVVGPVCESADVIARHCHLAAASNDVLVIFNTGAYGMVMASNYNARPRPSEVLVHGRSVRLIRRAQTMTDMMAYEINIEDAPSEW